MEEEYPVHTFTFKQNTNEDDGGGQKMEGSGEVRGVRKVCPPPRWFIQIQKIHQIFRQNNALKLDGAPLKIGDFFYLGRKKTGEKDGAQKTGEKEPRLNSPGSASDQRFLYKSS